MNPHEFETVDMLEYLSEMRIRAKPIHITTLKIYMIPNT